MQETSGDICRNMNRTCPRIGVGAIVHTEPILGGFTGLEWGLYWKKVKKFNTNRNE